MSELGLNIRSNVFVSHANEDMPLVDKLVKILNWNNINPLVAEYFQEPGRLLWKEKIKRLIKQCQFFVVLYTQNAQNKTKVHQEIGSAGILEKRIIVLLEGGMTPNTLVGYLEGLEVMENLNAYNPCDIFNNLTHLLLAEIYRREIDQFYGLDETCGKIMFRYDYTSSSWNRYKYDTILGNWILICPAKLRQSKRLVQTLIKI